MESDEVIENGSSGDDDDGVLDEDVPEGDEDLLDDAELDYTEDILEEANLITDDKRLSSQDTVSELIYSNYQ